MKVFVYEYPFYIGLVATLAVIVGLSVWSGSRGKSGGKLAPLAAGLLSCTAAVPGKVRPKYAMAAVIADSAAVLVFGIWKVLPFDSLFAGISLLIMIIGLLQKCPGLYKPGALYLLFVNPLLRRQCH